jgi:pimeloyl-ACP methyl ester carboxylesterase
MGVLLVHGWPGDAQDWRMVSADLARDYRVIAPDLRGFGRSAIPSTGYDAATLSADFGSVIEASGAKPVHVVAHDIGSNPAIMLAATRPDLVRSLTLVETIAPSLPASESASLGRFSHPGFHANADLPEALIQGREAQHIGWFHSHFAAKPGAVPAAETARAVARQRRPGALAAGFAPYRAGQQSAEQVKAATATKLTMPVFAIGGTVLTDLVVKSLWPESDNVRGTVLSQCGHWLPSECPAQLARTLRTNFTSQGRP